ncbi:MAG TPA: imidazole glycerol phosphate synthase subunit HisH [Pseudomonadales bacterium]|nr:imidazole glycerol phosphate synthase subunit HisH [Pseudomonadales bacterium]
MAESIIIVDYEAGNLRSVQRACHEVGMTATISANPDDLVKADRVIFPGVGSAASAVDTLRERGLDEALKTFYRSGRPLLGICLGAQIVLEFTEEDKRNCLGLVAGVCVRFDFADRTLKVPHIGWNEVEIVQPHPLLANTRSGDEFYFVHSYYVVPTHQENVYGVTEYGVRFCSMMGQDNLFATQFHLEKSGRLGINILGEFRCWKP